jgi:hypothetical protein
LINFGTIWGDSLQLQSGGLYLHPIFITGITIPIRTGGGWGLTAMLPPDGVAQLAGVLILFLTLSLEQFWFVEHFTDSF